jgi:hypothetical protein
MVLAKRNLPIAEPDKRTPEFVVAERFGSVQSQLGGHSLARIYVVQTIKGHLAVVKACNYKSAGAQKLLAEAAHLTWLRRRAKSYPAIIASGILAGCAYLVTPYYARPTLARSIDNLHDDMVAAAELCARCFVRAYSWSVCDVSNDLTTRTSIFRQAYIDRVRSRILGATGLAFARGRSPLIIDDVPFESPLAALDRLAENPRYISKLCCRNSSPWPCMEI